MAVLVTGGAGYIGSHVVRLLQGRNTDVVVVDDLSAGFRDRISGVPLLEIDLASASADARLQETMDEHDVQAVIHLAAHKRVEESIARPIWYYRQNVGGLINLLSAMQRSGVRDLVFSSSAAVYGRQEQQMLSETCIPAPLNPYGTTKLIGEQLIASLAEAGRLRATSLRYFNVAGAGSPALADREAANLIPLVIRAISEGVRPQIFGDDYATPDGTCIRDYVHVQDLADVHVLSLDALAGRTGGVRTYNVGTGSGASVREVIEKVASISSSRVDPLVTARRPGDPARVVADPALISHDLGWHARFGLEEIVASAWAAAKRTVSAART